MRETEDTNYCKLVNNIKFSRSTAEEKVFSNLFFGITYVKLEITTTITRKMKCRWNSYYRWFYRDNALRLVIFLDHVLVCTCVTHCRQKMRDIPPIEPLYMSDSSSYNVIWPWFRTRNSKDFFFRSRWSSSIINQQYWFQQY